MSKSLHLVLYDDECPMCTFQMRALTWLDWFRVLRFLPLSSGEAQAAAPGLTAEALQEAIHCITPEARIYRGARAIRFMGMRLPLLLPLALVLWIPGVILLAEVIYRWISRNRLGLSRLFGCKGACRVLPARVREQDRVG